jgi:hypothetical protein
MSEDIDVADVLNAAADYIATHGLAKEGFGSDDGPRCLLGAMSTAWQASDMPDSGTNPGCALWGVAAGAVSQAIGHPGIAKWNDAPERTADEVITALLEAAARLRCSP